METRLESGVGFSMTSNLRLQPLKKARDRRSFCYHVATRMPSVYSKLVLLTGTPDAIWDNDLQLLDHLRLHKPKRQASGIAPLSVVLGIHLS